jgi:cation diffusion facilitator family transporter
MSEKANNHPHAHEHEALGLSHPHAHPQEHDHHEHAHPGARRHGQGALHDHEQMHDHAHDHWHSHSHESPRNLVEWLLAIFHLGSHAHDHDHGGLAGSILETSTRGIWAIKWSFIGLMLTALMQVVIVYFSDSIALLADTIHNFGDAATAIPLWIAFSLARRPATRRYTYGYGRAEDLAGIAVVLLILFSAAVAAYQAIDRIVHPQEITHLAWVAAAAVIGFIGNEAVAIFRIRVGREIGSAALIADGQHARIDGLTSLAVLAGALGVWLGFPLADPLIGLLIAIAIVRIAWGAAWAMWYRMMDATDPGIVTTLEQTAGSVVGVSGVHCVRCRWVGHRLHAEVHIEVDPHVTVAAAHQLTEDVQHALFHALPRLSDIAVHVDLSGPDQAEFHETTLHHREPAEAVQAKPIG